MDVVHHLRPSAVHIQNRPAHQMVVSMIQPGWSTNGGILAALRRWQHEDGIVLSDQPEHYRYGTQG
jgi:hypothetical protein